METATILGAHLPNPYLIQTMKQAYTNITGQISTPAITNKYVRFKPADAAQLRTLDSIAGLSNIELFDEPLDYQIVQQCDYYQDPAIPLEQVTWQYAVVPATFVFPSGIQYELLASIHIPTNIAVEQEAERLAGLNADGDGLAGSTMPVSAQMASTNSVPEGDCPTGYVWDPILRDCVKQDVVTVDPSYTPGGKIMVFDTQLDDPSTNVAQPLRTVKLIARRWFKVEKTFTDNQGNFVFTKKFRRKVKLHARFVNQYCTIRGIRDARVWEALLPIEKKIGVYSGTSINTVSYIFKRPTDVTSKGMKKWVAATVLNGVQEHRDFSNSLSFSTAPADLNIYVTNWSSGSSAPMFRKRLFQSVPLPFVQSALVSDNHLIILALNTIAITLARANVDISIGYQTSNLPSDQLKESIYHEMSHGSHYVKAGNTLYSTFVNAVLEEMGATIGSVYNPYGHGNTGNSPIIALGEGWAYFMGHYLADQKYGILKSSAFSEPGQGYYQNNSPVAGLSSHLNLLEDFSPLRTVSDPFYWIPQGLMYDLMDTRNDNNAIPVRVPLNDNVSGYTISQFINALQSDISSMPAFKTRLLSQNGNNQATGVNAIFSFYGY